MTAKAIDYVTCDGYCSIEERMVGTSAFGVRPRAPKGWRRLVDDDTGKSLDLCPGCAQEAVHAVLVRPSKDRSVDLMRHAPMIAEMRAKESST